MNMAAEVKKKKKEKSDDGVKHINVWIHGNTELGRMLSHFYHSPFVHPELGPFNSMEGFWYYVKTKEKDDGLRQLSGIRAKEYGKKLTRQYVKDFHDIIIAANFYKIEQNERLKELLMESTLPFHFYYFFGPLEVKVSPPNYEWLMEGFEQIRSMLRDGRRPPDLDYSHLLKKE